MDRKKLIKKKEFKKIEGKCRICGETDYTLLDNHRIIEGCNSGEYKMNNVAVLCCKCHRLVHAGRIKIDKYYFSTKGYLLRIIKDGVEDFV